jgi:hypothetical protein
VESGNIDQMTGAEIQRLNPKAAGIGFRYHILVDVDQPAEVVEVEDTKILETVGLDINAPWTNIKIVSRGMSGGNEQTAISADAVLQMAISPDDRAIVVYDMAKKHDVDGNNLPSAAPIFDLIHYSYIAYAKDPSALKYFITQPIYQAGTQQVLEDALKAKSLKKGAMMTCLPSDDRNYAGHLPSPWYGLLGTRHGRIVLFILVCEP